MAYIVINLANNNEFKISISSSFLFLFFKEMNDDLSHF